ncbi:MAG TPA: alpha/beta fold hydrolase [Methyloceanibacter sp.]|jgi:pimeloyl-ACP methyl ester carboxylesterase|nr:alpha/beta fold hydrolase [Methyloceanibacter sp.]
MPIVDRRFELWALLLVAFCFSLCLGPRAGAAGEGPGSIVRVWPLEGGGPSGAGGTAFRILYRSTGLSGEPIEVTGAIFIPPGPAPAGGRDIIAWAHPTSGVVEACAPSLMPDLAGTIWGLAEMLARGYVVVATDYPGLGTPGPHPYLIGESEGRAVLDSVRAARDLPDAGASNRFAVWGHSQGGHASLYTGELAASYAPDLKLVGVAAAAPATYLAELFDADKSSPAGKELTAMALYAWSELTHDPASSLVDPPAMPVFEQLAHDCIESIAEFAAIENAEKPLNREEFLKGDPTEIEPWRGIMTKNTPGQAPAGAPVFLAQGAADTTVRPEITKQFGETLCKQGTRVEYVVLPGVDHTFAAKDSVGKALDWITERFRGAPAPSVCE